MARWDRDDKPSIPDWFWEAVETEPETRQIEVDECDVAYRFYPSPGRPGMLLIHGMNAHSRWWDFIAPSFLEDYCVVAIDLSGMGDSEHRQNYSQTLYGEEIKAVCDDMNWDSADFLAHSMAGPISVKTASTYPELFKSLFLLDSIIIVPPDKARSFSGRGSMVRKDFVYEDLDSAVESFRSVSYTHLTLPTKRIV